MDIGITQLQTATHTLHLLYHRNKNQHRHSKWWKWFSMLKRCVNKLKYEIQTGDSLRAQARVKHMNQVLLPRCYASFTQLIQDTQFSALGLILVAEVSGIQRLVIPYADRAEDEMSPATDLVNSRNTFPLNLFEDVGEAVGRTESSNPTDAGMYPVSAVDILKRPERSSGAEKCLQEREGAGRDAINPTHGEIVSQQAEFGAVIAGSKSHTSSAPIKRRGKSVNAIDDLFQGLH